MVLGTEPGCLRFRRCAKANGKLGGCEGTQGAGLTEPPFRKALPEMPAFKPYWGEPTVRDFRGDDGNVGIIRSPVRAIVLPDHSKNSRPRQSRPAAPGSGDAGDEDWQLLSRLPRQVSETQRRHHK